MTLLIVCIYSVKISIPASFLNPSGSLENVTCSSTCILSSSKMQILTKEFRLVCYLLPSVVFFVSSFWVLLKIKQTTTFGVSLLFLVGISCYCHHIVAHEYSSILLVDSLCICWSRKEVRSDWGYQSIWVSFISIPER